MGGGPGGPLNIEKRSAGLAARRPSVGDPGANEKIGFAKPEMASMSSPGMRPFELAEPSLWRKWTAVTNHYRSEICCDRHLPYDDLYSPWRSPEE